jgi:hypothetical protein
MAKEGIKSRIHLLSKRKTHFYAAITYAYQGYLYKGAYHSPQAQKQDDKKNRRVEEVLENRIDIYT